MRSLRRPVTNSSPSSRKPRSPVRRKGPSPVPAMRALKGSLGLFGSVPVAARDAGASDPDLADLIGLAPLKSSGWTMASCCPPSRCAAARRARRLCRRRPRPRRHDDSQAPQPLRARRAAEPRAGSPRRAASPPQVRSRAGTPRAGSRTGRRPREPLQRLQPDGLGAVEGHLPASSGQATRAAPRSPCARRGRRRSSARRSSSRGSARWPLASGRDFAGRRPATSARTARPRRAAG